mmetsp:Transcript_165938/g.532718  ORF Transcript_165938/g.532718 Transcript_165938/m.532718 type:complete len:200 (+) Transcript_165938:481-1080(+)
MAGDPSHAILHDGLALVLLHDHAQEGRVTVALQEVIEAGARHVLHEPAPLLPFDNALVVQYRGMGPVLQDFVGHDLAELVVLGVDDNPHKLLLVRERRRGGGHGGKDELGPALAAPARAARPSVAGIVLELVALLHAGRDAPHRLFLLGVLVAVALPRLIDVRNPLLLEPILSRRRCWDIPGVPRRGGGIGGRPSPSRR